MKDIINGSIGNDPLTDKGVKQAKEVAGKLKKVKFDAVYSSNLLRAQKTAEIIAMEHKLEVQTTNLLRERNYGKYEGQSRETLETFNKLYETMAKEDRKKHRLSDTAETEEEVLARFINFIREAAVTHPGKTILVATHGGIMRVFLYHLGYEHLKYFNRSYIRNTSYIKLLSDGVEFFIEETYGITLPT